MVKVNPVDVLSCILNLYGGRRWQTEFHSACNHYLFQIFHFSKTFSSSISCFVSTRKLRHGVTWVWNSEIFFKLVVVLSKQYRWQDEAHIHTYMWSEASQAPSTSGAEGKGCGVCQQLEGEQEGLGRWSNILSVTALPRVKVAVVAAAAAAMEDLAQAAVALGFGSQRAVLGATPGPQICYWTWGYICCGRLPKVGEASFYSPLLPPSQKCCWMQCCPAQLLWLGRAACAVAKIPGSGCNFGIPSIVGYWG